MQEEIANLVHPVFSHALALRDRLEKGESPNIDIEQATLKGMLLPEVEARRWVDFGGDAPRDKPGEQAGPFFLGIRYALVCWLDELIILHSPWEGAWNERKLEVALYGTNDRAWRFWEQARIAETRSVSDALEVFFLCVMLGFRGELRETPEKLRGWVAASQAHLGGNRALEWEGPPELEPITNVPQLRARDRLQKLALAAGMVLLILIPVAVFFVVRQLGH